MQVTPGTVNDYIICPAKGKGLHTCAVCLVHIKERKNVRDHIRAVHLNIRNHRCDFCYEAFTKKAHRIRHEKKCKNRPGVDM